MQSRSGTVPLPFPNVGQAVLLMIGAVALQVCAMATIVAGTTLLSGTAPTDAKDALNPWTLGAVNLFAIGMVLALGLRATREPPGRFFRLRPFPGRLIPPVVVTSLGFAIVLHKTDTVLSDGLHRLLGTPLAQPDILKLAAYPWGAFLLLVIVAPVSEEYLFRRMILHGLLARQRTFVAVGLSALLFAFMHLNLRQMFLGLVIGVIFGWWYARTASVGPGLIGHALFNSVACVDTLFPGALLAFGHRAPDNPALQQYWWTTLGGAGLAGLGLWWFKSVAGSLEPAEPPRLPPPAAPPLLSEPPLIHPTDTPAV